MSSAADYWEKVAAARFRVDAYDRTDEEVTPAEAEETLAFVSDYHPELAAEMRTMPPDQFGELWKLARDDMHRIRAGVEPRYIVGVPSRGEPDPPA